MRAKFFGAIAGVIVFLSASSNAKAQCPTTMVISQAPIGQECGAQVSFEVTNPNGFQFVQFALDGNPISTQSSGSIYLEPGTYLIASSTADVNNCTQYIEEEITILPAVTVQFQNNTVACNGTLALNVGVQGGSGNYTYAWEPSALMNNPTASAPAMTVGTSSEVVSVTVTDDLGCSQFAEMVVYPNLPVNQTLELCSGSATLSLDPGSLMYNWSATDANGDEIDMTGVTGNVFDATTLGTYVVVTYYMGCNVTTHQFIVEECTSTACPTVMAVTQTPSGCGADVTFAVNNPNGFQFVQFALDGTPISTQTSGSTYLDPGTYVIASSTADANNCTMYLEEEITVLSPTGLSAFITVQANPCGGQCSGQLMAGANGGTAPYAYFWSTLEVGPVSVQLCEGDYFVEVWDSNGCSDTASVTLPEAGLTVAFFSDTVACNGSLMLDNSTSGGSGDYSFAWTPASMMNDPFAEFPIMNVGTEITLVSVTVTDNVTGCVTTESLLVYPNLPVQSIVNLCNGFAELMVDPGSIAYNWMGTDLDGNSIDMSGAAGNAFEAAVAGEYIVVTYYGGCNVTTHIFEVEECIAPSDDVWPGDANSDGEATNTDALWVGLAFNQTGPVRAAASNAWIGQPATDWTFDFAQNGVNLKHADCDGNGVVNFADTIAISQNYGLTHGKTESVLGGGYPMLWVEATPDTVGLSQAVNITVHLADVAMPVDSLHGIAFTLTFNETLVVADDLAIDFSNNTLGTVGSDVLTLQKPFFPNGEIDVAISRTTLENYAGYGPLLTARIVTTDNLSGVHELRFGITGVTAITASEAPVVFTTMADTVFVDSDHVGINDLSELDFRVYPNPSQGVFQLEGLEGNVNVEVMDATGRVVERLQNNGNGKLTVDMSHQTTGMYVMRVWNETGFAVKRVELLGH